MTHDERMKLLAKAIFYASEIERLMDKIIIECECLVDID